MASTYLTRTTGTPTSGKKYTWSVWTKINPNSSAHNYLFSEYRTGNDRDEFAILSASNDNFRWESLNSGNNVAYFQTNRVFRDCNAWYHFVFAYDSTLATSTDRWKFYVNGVQETSFSASMYPAQNAEGSINISGITQNIGQRGGSYGYLDGSMSHMHFIDGTAYDASAFGETDATTGIWKPKTAPSVTYGTNGFFLKFENSGAFGTDSSGNANNFTVNGTMTQTIDTPSNVFATLNPLYLMTAQPTFSYGNLRITNSLTDKAETSYSTIAPSSGKWYAEFKCTSGTVFRPGISSTNAGQANGDPSENQNYPGMNSEGWGWYYANGIVYNNGTTIGTTLSTFTQGDIVAVGLDLDNMKLYFSKNGTWQNSADPSAGTGGIDISSISSGSNVVIGMQVENSSAGSTLADANFGNGYFGTTQVSSAQNPDDGIGIFEYAVPTGYKALCTKSINAQEYD